MLTHRPPLLLAALACATLSAPAPAAEFCVGTPGALASALNVADNNGQSDEIRLQQGTFVGNFIYNANAAETGDLTVRGGYDATCSASSGNPSDTTLDGNDAARTLVLSGRDNSALLLDAVTVRGGLGQTNGAGAEIDRWVTATVSNSRFVDNNIAAGQDGAAGMDIDRTVNVFVTGNEFSDNSGGKGGGMAASDMDVARITHNVFANNTAVFGGGAMDVSTFGSVTLANNLFSNNSTPDDGGAIDLNLETTGPASTLQATNNTLVGNSAGGDGGALDLKMTGDASSASLHNNLFWNNFAGRGADMSIDNDDDENGVASPVAMEFNDFNHAFFTGFFSELPIAISGSNLNAVDPVFVDAASGNFSLAAGSPLIDAGDSGAPDAGSTDLAGGPRIQGAAIDIGSFESAVDVDSDGDGIVDALDNCTQAANPGQLDTNGDGFGNACDADLNNDNAINSVDLGLLRSVFFTADADADFNGDGVVNSADLGVMKASYFGAPGPSGLAP